MLEKQLGNWNIFYFNQTNISNRCLNNIEEQFKHITKNYILYIHIIVQICL